MQSEPDKGSSFIVTLPVQRSDTSLVSGEGIKELITSSKEENEEQKLNGKPNKNKNGPR